VSTRNSVLFDSQKRKPLKRPVSAAKRIELKIQIADAGLASKPTEDNLNEFLEVDLESRFIRLKSHLIDSSDSDMVAST
jgi:hypothetical protein